MREKRAFRDKLWALAHFVAGISQSQIARSEGVHHTTVSRAIRRTRIEAGLMASASRG